jgi:CRISPR/Cas system-associated protein Csm6
MSKIVNLTPQILRAIIAEEKKKIAKKVRTKKAPDDLEKVAHQTREVEAKDMAHTLVKDVNHYKELQKEATRLAARLSEVNEARQEIRQHILEQL